MPRITVEQCPLCKSVVRSVECESGHTYYAPVVEGQLSVEENRQKILKMIAESKYNSARLETAMQMLLQLEQFLEQKGHKIMGLQLKRTLDSIRDRRAE